jgi:hypothetical protein
MKTIIPPIRIYRRLLPITKLTLSENLKTDDSELTTIFSNKN